MNTRSTQLLKEAQALKQSLAFVRDAALRDAKGSDHRQVFLKHMVAIETAVLKQAAAMEDAAMRGQALRPVSNQLSAQESVHIAATRIWSRKGPAAQHTPDGGDSA